MRNIIIIGPPASGKLTIAKALAKEKGYFLFDNHRSIDAVGIDRVYSKYDVETDYVSSTVEVLHLNTSELSVHESVKAIMEKIEQ